MFSNGRTTISAVTRHTTLWVGNYGTLAWVFSVSASRARDADLPEPSELKQVPVRGSLCIDDDLEVGALDCSYANTSAQS